MTTDALRIWTKDGAYSFLSSNMEELLLEIDSRLNGARVYSSITRSGYSISEINYYLEQARTTLLIKRQITYTPNFRLSTITSIFYNLIGGEDCRIIETSYRDGLGNITHTDSVYTTTEDQAL